MVVSDRSGDCAAPKIAENCSLLFCVYYWRYVIIIKVTVVCFSEILSMAQTTTILKRSLLMVVLVACLWDTERVLGILNMAKHATILGRFLLIALLAACVFFGVILLRTLLLQKLPPETDICSPSEDDFIALDDAMIRRFQAALRFRTVSRTQNDYDREQLKLLDDHIVNSEYCIS